MSKMFDIASVGFGAFSIYNQQRLHKKELHNARELHKQSIELSKRLTNKSLVEVKRFYLLELFNNLAQHFQQLNADLIASAKEAERDMFDQRNQSLQTIILSGSVMFGALSTAIVNGTLQELKDEIVYGYGICSAISFGALFISIVLCIETVIRASLFMYHRAQYFTFVLQEAIDQTRNIMGQMRQKTENLNVEKMVKIAKMTKKQLNEEWEEHAKIIKKYLKHRKNINHRLAAFRGGSRVNQNQGANDDNASDENNFNRFINNPNRNLRQQRRPDNTWCMGLIDVDEIKDFCSCCLKRGNNYAKLSKMTFNEFWEEKCQDYASWALFLFYVGTGNLIVTICFYLYSKFYKYYKNFEMAVVSATLVGLFFLCGFFIAAYLRAKSRKFRIEVEDDQELEDEEERKRRKKEDDDSDEEEDGLGEETIRDDDDDNDNYAYNRRYRRGEGDERKDRYGDIEMV
jgi:hypothetical protein